ncbi:MAG: hypothetical protein LBQ54_07225 [Planctomycetaceae bacterium]|jgi:hypothetical protein|nr:hypothetical protein [Planctomycetaceae bacterium]
MQKTDSLPLPDEKVIPELKNPLIAAVLAWLVPGLGHLYQGRRNKAILFFTSIMVIFVFGCYFGSDKDYGAARVIYYSWGSSAPESAERRGPQNIVLEPRYYFIPQACLGMAAIPAMIQAKRVGSGNEPYWGGFMAPPAVFNAFDSKANPSLNQLIARMNRFFEIGTIYTVVAGLMNVLVIFDALRGPLYEEEKKNSKPAAEAKV